MKASQNRVVLALAILAVVALFVAACGGASATATPATTTGGGTGATSGVSFAKDVLPILQRSCTRCHGGSNPRQGMSLETYAGVMKGSSNGAVVVAGDPAKSVMYSLVNSGAMPQGGTKLSAADIQKISDWIKAGAANN